MPIVLKSGSLNLLEPSGPVQACNGIALPFTFTLLYNGAVGIVTRLQTAESGVGTPAGARDFSLLESIRSSSGALTMSALPGLMRPWREADH